MFVFKTRFENLPFLIFFFVQICSRGCSWQNRCTDFQEICYSAAPFLSYPVILDSKYWGHSTIFGFEKSNENYHFFRLSTFQFFLLSFYWNYEALTAKPYAEWFSQAFKITFKKIKGINRICLKWSLWKSSTFLIFVLQICLGGCSWYSVNTDFQEICYSTTQSLSDVLKSEFWILGALHHVCSRKVLMRTIIYSTSSLLNFLDGFSSLSAKNRY